MTNQKSDGTGLLNYLVVDDSKTMRIMVLKVLKRLEAGEVFEAHNGKKALEVLDAHEVNFIICDWNMPYMSGIELLRAVRSMDRYKRIPFLMLTAEAQLDNALEAQHEGANGYLTKPFKANMLKEKIEHILSF